MFAYLRIGKCLCVGVGLLGQAQHAAEGSDDGQDSGDGPLVKDMHGDAAAYQFGRYVRLYVGKSHHQVRFKLQDSPDPGGGKCGDFWLFLPGSLGPHGEPGYPDDAVLGADGVEGLVVSSVRQTMRSG
jgi:hypothetical protein